MKKRIMKECTYGSVQIIIGINILEIRRFQNSDAKEVFALIATTLRTSNRKDYSEEYIENAVKVLQPNNILERAGWTHFYVVCDNGKTNYCL